MLKSRLIYRIVFVFVFFSGFSIPTLSAVEQAPALTLAEKALLERAVDDYLFHEFGQAIETLEALRADHPDNARILRYLKSSYMESSNNPVLSSRGEGGASRAFHGDINLGGFYTNNVDLLPDVVARNPGKTTGDYALQTNLSLAYNIASWRLGYTVDAHWFRKRTEFNLAVQRVSADWFSKPWRIGLHFDHATLGKERLFFAQGLDVGWAQDAWSIGYGLRFKQFNRAYGTSQTDLGRLSGVSNALDIGYHWQIEDTILYTVVNALYERTHGDATHDKTDDYYQGGISAGMKQNFSSSVQASLDVRGYYRGYQNPDTTILITGNKRRRDVYFKVGSDVGYSFGAENSQQLRAFAHWQKNQSNYKQPIVTAAQEKEFSEWRAGASWRYQW